MVPKHPPKKAIYFFIDNQKFHWEWRKNNLKYNWYVQPEIQLVCSRDFSIKITSENLIDKSNLKKKEEIGCYQKHPSNHTRVLK